VPRSPASKAALDAEQLYEQAIRSARENGFVHNEAVANELASRFYAARGFETISRAYLRNARYCYLRWERTARWGSSTSYPQLGDEPPVASATSTIGTPSKTSTSRPWSRCRKRSRAQLS
jgi:hypothetical protein